MSGAAGDDRVGETPSAPRGPAAPGALARVFVAVDVGDAVRAEARRVIQVLSGKLEAAKTPPKIAWVSLASLHVTVRFIGEVDEATLPGLCEKLAPPIPVAPFEVEWRGLGVFPSVKHPRALWLGVVSGGAALGAIEAEVSRRLAGTIDPDARPLLPHLTLGRVKMAGSGIDWPKLLQAVEVRGVRSVVDRVTLYRSERPRAGARPRVPGAEGHRGPHYTGLVSAPLIADTA